MVTSKSSIYAISKLSFIKIALLLYSPTVHSSSVVVREGPRSRSSGSSFDTPTDAPFGFFVDGSSIPGMNGMYGPKLPHRRTDDEIDNLPEPLEGHVYMGAYKHDSSGWWLVNLGHSASPDGPEGPEWVFIDPLGRNRFSHPGGVPVPGYGTAWSHVKNRHAKRSDIHVITEHEDKDELPRLVAPVPDDRNDCVTSFVFEQLLVQLKRQRIAVAHAEGIRAKNFNSSNFLDQTCPASVAPCPSATNTTEAGYTSAADVLIDDAAFTEASECFAAAAWHSNDTESAAEMFLQQSKVLRWARDFDGAAVAAQAVLGSCTGPTAVATAKNPRVLLGRAHMAMGEIFVDMGMYDAALESLELAYAAFFFESPEGVAEQEIIEQLKQLLVSTHAAIRRQSFPPVPRLVAPPAQEKDGCILVRAGKHLRTWPHNVKTMYMEIPEGYRCPNRVDRTNWLGDEGFDRNEMQLAFLVTQSYNAAGNGKLEISRLPEEGVEFTQGWALNLAFHCCSNNFIEGPKAGSVAETDSEQGAEENSEKESEEDSKKDAEDDDALSGDHYLVLQLSRDFRPEQLKRNFRKISRTYHPDKPGGSVAKFEHISAAHDCLDNEACRADFDEGVDMGRAGKDNNQFSFKEDVEQIYFPEKYPFHPFGDPMHFCRGWDCPNGPNRG